MIAPKIMLTTAILTYNTESIDVERSAGEADAVCVH